MTHSRFWLLFLVLAPFAFAQEKPDAPAKSPALVEFEALVNDFRSSTAEFSKKLRAAKTDEERKELQGNHEQNPTHLFRPKFAAAAEKYKNSDDAVRFLNWLVQTGVQAKVDVETELGLLLSTHLKSDQLESFVGRTVAALKGTKGDTWVAETLDKIYAENPHGVVKGTILFNRVNSRIAYGESVEAGKWAELKVMFQEVITLAGADSALGKRAAGVIFEQENLTVGKTAPDFEANDVDGVAFKLSDYQGKVVIVDFWGTW